MVVSLDPQPNLVAHIVKRATLMSSEVIVFQIISVSKDQNFKRFLLWDIIIVLHVSQHKKSISVHIRLNKTIVPDVPPQSVFGRDPIVIGAIPMKRQI